MSEELKLIELGNDVMYVENHTNDLLRDYPGAFEGGICTTQQLEKSGLIATSRKIIKNVLDKLDKLTGDDGAEYLVTESSLGYGERVIIQSLEDFNQARLNVAIHTSSGVNTTKYWTLDRKKRAEIHIPEGTRDSIPPSAAPPA